MTHVSSDPGTSRGDEEIPPLEWTGERFIPTEGGPEIYYEHSHRYVLARSALAGRAVVDLASGEGYGAAWIAEVADSVVGVDIDAASVRHASARYASCGNLRFLQGDIEQLPLADGCADAVTCYEAIEHVPNPRRVVEETVRILKPGGLFFVSTPNKALYTDAREYTNEFHVHEFYLPEFEQLLDEFFPGHMLFGQRVVAGSLTWPLDQEGAVGGPSPDGPAGVLLAPGFGDKPSMVDPLYVVACCRLGGDRPEPFPTTAATVLVDPEETLLDAFRRGASPADIATARAQLEAYERDIRELQKRLVEVDHDVARLAADREVLRTAHLESAGMIRRQQEVATRFGEEARAATELSARLLAELRAAQEAIMELQFSRPVPAPRSAEPVTPPPPPPVTPAGSLLSLARRARHLVAQTLRRAG